MTTPISKGVKRRPFRETEFMANNSSRRKTPRGAMQNQSYPNANMPASLHIREIDNPFSNYSVGPRTSRQFGTELLQEVNLDSPPTVPFQEVTSQGIMYLRSPQGELYYHPSQPRLSTATNRFSDNLVKKEEDRPDLENIHESIGASETVLSADGSRPPPSLNYDVSDFDENDDVINCDPLALGAKFASVLSSAETTEEVEELLAEVNTNLTPLNLINVSKAAVAAKDRSKDLWNALLGFGIYLNGQRNVSKVLLNKTSLFAKSIKKDSNSIINGISFTDCTITPYMRALTTPHSKDFVTGLNLSDALRTIQSNLARRRYIGTTLKTNSMAWKYVILGLYFKMLKRKEDFPLLVFQPSRPKCDVVNVMSEANFSTTNAVLDLLTHYTGMNDTPKQNDFEKVIMNTIQEALKEGRRMVTDKARRRHGEGVKHMNYFRMLIGEDPVEDTSQVDNPAQDEVEEVSPLQVNSETSPYDFQIVSFEPVYPNDE